MVDATSTADEADGRPGGRPWWSSGDTAGRAEPGPWQRRDRPAHHDQVAEEHRIETCGICPLCAVIRVFGEARPEVVEHLSEATRHLTLALQAAVDAKATGSWGRRGVERIDVD